MIMWYDVLTTEAMWNDVYKPNGNEISDRYDIIRNITADCFISLYFVEDQLLKELFEFLLYHISKCSCK